MLDQCAMVDFLYHGEANVYQENLDSFLAIAEELQLKGLMGKSEENLEAFVEDKTSAPKVTKPATHNDVKTPRASQNNKQLQNCNDFGAGTDKTVAVQNYTSVDLEDLEERVKSMMEKSKNNYANTNYKAYICKVCGKEGQLNAIKEHIEANHLGGMTFPCNLCDKTPRSRHALKLHKYTYHK